MTHNFKVSAVIFDMDGLMLDTERIGQRAWARAMADWGYTLPLEMYLTLIGRTAHNTRQVLRETFGSDLPIDEIFERKQLYAEEVIATEGILIKSGLSELLDELDQWRWPRAIATSTVRSFAMRKLERAGLLSRFEVLAFGDEVKHGKPAPDIFLLAAQRLDVEPAQCIVLEDSDAGVQAAHAAGMRSLMVPDMKPPSDESVERAHRIFISLHEVRSFLGELNAERPEG